MNDKLIRQLQSLNEGLLELLHPTPLPPPNPEIEMKRLARVMIDNPGTNAVKCKDCDKIMSGYRGIGEVRFALDQCSKCRFNEAEHEHMPA